MLDVSLKNLNYIYTTYNIQHILKDFERFQNDTCFLNYI